MSITRLSAIVCCSTVFCDNVLIQRSTNLTFLATVKPLIGPHLLNLLLLDQARICFSENGFVYLNSMETVHLKFPLDGEGGGVH